MKILKEVPKRSRSVMNEGLVFPLTKEHLIHLNFREEDGK